MIAKRTLATAALLTLLFFLLSACAPSSSNRRSTPTPVPTLVKYEPAIFTVERGTIVAQKSISGEIVPAQQETLSFRAAGMVARLTVKTGDRVKQGDLLAELEVDDLLNQIKQARIDLEVAQGALEKAKNDREYAAQKSQIDLNIAQARLDSANLELENSFGLARQRAEINLRIAEENLKTAQLNLQQIGDATSAKEEQVLARQKLSLDRLESLLAERQIIAPYDGVILRVMFIAGKQITAFTPAIDIGDPAELIIRASLDTALEPKMNRDTEVQMSLTSSSDAVYPVTYLPDFIPFSALNADKQQAFNQDWMYFSPPQDLPAAELKLGSKVNLNVIIGRAQDVLLLAPSAIRNYRGLNFVIVQNGERRQRVEISKIGLKTDQKWEIEGELQPGDRVVGP